MVIVKIMDFFKNVKKQVFSLRKFNNFRNFTFLLLYEKL